MKTMLISSDALHAFHRDDREPAVDFEQLGRRYRLSEAISARTCAAALELTVPSQTILEQAGDRYFGLIDSARRSLRGRFSEIDWDIMSNVECSPIWQWNAQTSMATMVADDHGVEYLDDLEPESDLRILLEKLVQLSPLENAALVDACEQIWRGQQNPLLNT